MPVKGGRVGGFAVAPPRLVATGQVVRGLSADVTDVASMLAEVPGLPAPVAGTGIGAAVAAVHAAWADVLPKLSRELTLLADAVTSAAQMYQAAETSAQKRFEEFTR